MVKTGLYFQDPKYSLRRGFIRDPSLVFDAPLYQLDGAKFMSKDAYGHLCSVTGARRGFNWWDFDGVDDFISCGVIKDVSSEFTISIWMKFDTAHTGALFAGTTSRWRPFIGFNLDSTIQIIAHPNDGYLVSTIVLDIPGWYFITARFKDKYKAISIDGALDLEETDPTYSAGWDTAGHKIGARAATSEMFFDGLIGEVWVYNRLLSLLEDQRNYLATKWRYR